MMQDFVGFTYNGYHSIRDLGIYRTSNSNRYDESLTATMQDKTADVPGRDGQYYFGTTFKNRTFTVNYAFDNLSESKIRKIKEVFAGDGIHELVFDETPYKAWSAKVTGTASMKHLCFEENGERVYKGEGSITFTSYSPYAHTPSKLWTVDEEGNWEYLSLDGKVLRNYSTEAYPNKDEWQEASGLEDAMVSSDGRIIRFYNNSGETKDVWRLGISKKEYKFNANWENHIIYLQDMARVLQYNGNSALRFKTGCYLEWNLDTNSVFLYEGDTSALINTSKIKDEPIPNNIQDSNCYKYARLANNKSGNTFYYCDTTDNIATRGDNHISVGMKSKGWNFLITNDSSQMATEGIWGIGVSNQEQLSSQSLLTPKQMSAVLEFTEKLKFPIGKALYWDILQRKFSIDNNEYSHKQLKPLITAATGYVNIVDTSGYKVNDLVRFSYKKPSAHENEGIFTNTIMASPKTEEGSRPRHGIGFFSDRNRIIRITPKTGLSFPSGSQQITTICIPNNTEKKEIVLTIQGEFSGQGTLIWEVDHNILKLVQGTTTIYLAIGFDAPVGGLLTGINSAWNSFVKNPTSLQINPTQEEIDNRSHTAATDNYDIEIEEEGALDTLVNVGDKETPFIMSFKSNSSLTIKKLVANFGKQNIELALPTTPTLSAGDEFTWNSESGLITVTNNSTKKTTIIPVTNNSCQKIPLKGTLGKNSFYFSEDGTNYYTLKQLEKNSAIYAIRTDAQLLYL